VSEIAKKVFEQNREAFLEGTCSIEELYEATTDQPIKNKNLCAFLLILNPDNPQYEERLNCLETEHQMLSTGFATVHAGFIEKEGEAARIGIFNYDFPEEKIFQILGNVLFDVYKIQ